MCPGFGAKLCKLDVEAHQRNSFDKKSANLASDWIGLSKKSPFTCLQPAEKGGWLRNAV
jgi:hypothetical protein